MHGRCTADARQMHGRCTVKARQAPHCKCTVLQHVHQVPPGELTQGTPSPAAVPSPAASPQSTAVGVAALSLILSPNLMRGSEPHSQPRRRPPSPRRAAAPPRRRATSPRPGAPTRADAPPVRADAHTRSPPRCRAARPTSRGR